MRNIFGCIALVIFAAACGGDGKSPTGPNPPTPIPHTYPPETNPGSVVQGNVYTVGPAGTRIVAHTRGRCGTAILASAGMITVVDKTTFRVVNNTVQGTPAAVATDCSVIAFTTGTHSIQLVDMDWGNPHELRVSNLLDRIAFMAFLSPNVLEVFGANGVRQTWNTETRLTTGSKLPNITGVTGISSLPDGGAVIGAGPEIIVLNQNGEISQRIGGSFVNPRAATYGHVTSFPNGKLLTSLDSLVQSFFRDPNHPSAPHFLDRSTWTMDRPLMATAATDTSYYVATSANEIQFWHIPPGPVQDLRVRHNIGCAPSFMMEGGPNQVLAYCESTGALTTWQRR